MLSKRLNAIDEMIKQPYINIWDCCCDHGLLGKHLLMQRSANVIHFVDIVPNLIEKLTTELEQHFTQNTFIRSWQTHCINVADLPLIKLGNNSQKKQLIIIAGVGGDRLIELFESIIKKYLHSDLLAQLEFILCPVHHNYKVRETLIANNMALIDERLIKDNQRFYEILHVGKPTNKDAKSKISNIGSIMWDLSQDEHQQYLDKTITHYKRLSLNPKSNVKHIIKAYSTLLYPLPLKVHDCSGR
jgi:tRNA (adenine22-N1)-methyltransferase